MTGKNKIKPEDRKKFRLKPMDDYIKTKDPPELKFAIWLVEPNPYLSFVVYHNHTKYNHPRINGCYRKGEMYICDECGASVPRQEVIDFMDSGQPCWPVDVVTSPE